MQNKEAEKKFFDTVTSESPWTTFNKNGQRQIFLLFEQKVQPKEGEIAVDMGCGTGEFTEQLAQYELKVHGIDIAKNLIDICKKKHAKNKDMIFEEQDIEHTNFKENSVDIIFLGGVLHHFPNREKVFKEAYRILKKDGRIYAFDPNYYNFIIWVYRELLGIKTQKTENEILVKAQEVREELRSVGFSEIEVQGAANMTFDARYFQKLVPFPLYYGAYIYNAIERAIHCIKPLEKKHGSFVITYARK